MSSGCRCFFAHEFDQQVVDAFERRSARSVSTSGTASAAREDIVEADDGEHALLAGSATRLSVALEDRDAGRFGSDQRARDVEALLRQQLIEIFVAGDAARDLGIARADQVAVAVAECVEGAIDLRAPAAVCENVAELARRSLRPTVIRSPS